MKRVLPVLTCLTLALSSALCHAELDLRQLQTRLRKIESELGLGTLGVGVKDLQTGQTVFLQDGKRFPMQSVFKLPLAVAVLRLVDTGRLSLDHQITIAAKDLSVPYSSINEGFSGKPRSYSVRRLLVLSTGGSDNTAADTLVALVGGPAKATQILKSLGVQGIRIDRYERELQMEYCGLGPFRPEWAREEVLGPAIDRVPKARAQAALRAYLADPRDTATLAGTVNFLENLQAGKLLSKASTQFLLEVMAKSPTGQNRLIAGVPAGAKVAHKTGTGRTIHGVVGAVNDIGILTLPKGQRVVVAVFVKGSPGPTRRIEKGIANVAKVVAGSVR
jgi:beta-lactamase class A